MGNELPLRESAEIQGDILAGFKKDHVRLLLLRFGDRRRARAWLGRLRHRIATTADVAAFNSAFSRARRTAEGPTRWTRRRCGGGSPSPTPGSRS